MSDPTYVERLRQDIRERGDRLFADLRVIKILLAVLIGVLFVVGWRIGG
jgi:hypothetical protein